MDHISPIIITILYFLVYFNRNRIKKVKWLRFCYDLLKESCSFRINSWFKSVILPIVSIILLWIFLSFFMNSVSSDYFLFGKIVTVLFTPLSEELFIRGIFLGTFVYLIVGLILKKKKIKDRRYIYILLMGLFSILVSIFFSFQHNPPNNFRYLISVYWCFLYLWDDRNLTPAVLGHATNNFLVMFIY